MLKELLLVNAALNYTCLIDSPSNSQYFFSINSGLVGKDSNMKCL